MDATGVVILGWERGFETPQMTTLKEIQSWHRFSPFWLLFNAFMREVKQNQVLITIYHAGGTSIRLGLEAK